MKLISSLIAIVAATGKYATSDNGSDCINGWTKVTGQNQCDPPASFTSAITCSNDGMKFNLKPSHVFDDFSRIPNDVLSTLSVDIAGSSAVYKKIITFLGDNTNDVQFEADLKWANYAPILHTEVDRIYMTFKVKVDDPSISFGSSTIFTTRAVNEFYVRCYIKNQLQVSSSSLTMETVNLGAATNGTASNEIDSSNIFSIGTYTDNLYQTTKDTFNIGEAVFAKVSGTGMANMPSGLKWAVNECKAVGDDDTHEMAIFQSDGVCKNPYLDVTTDTATATHRGFKFKSFTFGSNNANDDIEITCSIKFGQGTDQVSDSGVNCVSPLA